MLACTVFVFIFQKQKIIQLGAGVILSNRYKRIVLIALISVFRFINGILAPRSFFCEAHDYYSLSISWRKEQ